VELEIFCSKCGNAREDALDFKCRCGSPFDTKLGFPFRMPTAEQATLRRYIRNFPYLRDDRIVTLGERPTPLVQVADESLLKLDYMSPTFSFKDRGASVLISSILSSGKRVSSVREDSSGNAGASIAAYAARAGLGAEIFVPESVSGAKADQISAYGAELVRVKGRRSDVAAAAQRDKPGSAYIGHIWHPFFRDGLRTLAYEICEQLDWNSPDYVFLPVSAGTLLLGLISGFKHLLESEAVAKMPHIVCAQTQAVSPLYHRLRGEEYTPPENAESIADALVSTEPPLLDLMVKECRSVSAECLAITEEEILTSWLELSHKGFFVEPSSAVAYAAKKNYPAERLEGSSSVIVLTGAGLKKTSFRASALRA
jgi:threonine synthase